MELILIVILVALAVLNVYVSVRCYRNALSSLGQRLAQVAFIWTVPLFGAALALRMLPNKRERSAGKHPLEARSEDDFCTWSGSLNSNGYISSPDDSFHSAGGGDAFRD